MLLLETAMIGTLVAMDMVLFYVFWELMLIPMYLLIGIWGGERRLYASLKFFIYTFAGSVLMLVAILYMYTKGGLQSFAYLDFLKNGMGIKEQMWLFAAFGLALMIKVPIFLFHMVARCPRRVPNRRFSHPGRCLAEDGDIRLLG